MPRTCTVCHHPDRAAIDQALVVDKLSFRDIARQWRVSKDAIARHQAHIPAALSKAQEAKEIAEADTLLGEVREAKGRGQRLYAAAEEILNRALQAADLRVALQAIRAAVDVMGEARAHLELEGEITGELNGQEGGNRQVIVVLPALAQPGKPLPLNVAIPEKAIQKAIAERRGPVTDAPVVEVPRQGQKLLSPGEGDGQEEVD
jgi:hypothetical protein